jgi:hypothetical protein
MSACPRAGCAKRASPVRRGGCGNRDHGTAAQAPPDERGGNRYAGPNVHCATLLLYRKTIVQGKPDGSGEPVVTTHVLSTNAHGAAGASDTRLSLRPLLSRDDDTQTSGASRREMPTCVCCLKFESISAALHSSQRRDVQELGNAGHSAATIASSPSVSAVGPGCRISGGRTA